MDCCRYTSPKIEIVSDKLGFDVLSSSPGAGGIEGVGYEDWNDLTESGN